MKERLLLLFLCAVTFASAQQVSNDDFTTGVAVLPENSPGVGAGWYGNTNVSIQGGVAKMIFNTDKSSLFRQDVLFTQPGTYQLSYDISQSVANVATTSLIVTLRSEMNTILNIWQADSHAPSSAAKIGGSLNNMQSLFNEVTTSMVTHSGQFFVAEPNQTITLYFSINTNGGTLQEYFAIDNIGLELLTPLSVDNITIPDLYYYPNPVKDMLYLYAVTEIDEVCVYNTVGELLLKDTSKRNSINLSKLDPGNYVVRVVSKGVSESFTVMKV